MLSEYAAMLFSAILIGGIISMVFPKNKSSRLDKYISFTASLVCLLLFLSPVRGFCSDIGERINSGEFDGILSDEQYKNEFNATNKKIIEIGRQNIENSIKNTLCKKFDINENDITVTLFIDDADMENIIIKKAEVILSGRALWKSSYEIMIFVRETYDIECEVKGK